MIIDTLSLPVDTARMTYEQLVGHYRGLTKAAQALGLKRQTVHAWGIRKHIPSRWQIEIEGKTDGRLRADSAARREALVLAAYVQRTAKAAP